MANKKDEEYKKTGFNAPSIGVAVPKGYVMVKTKDGRIDFVPPKKKKEKK